MLSNEFFGGCTTDAGGNFYITGTCFKSGYPVVPTTNFSYASIPTLPGDAIATKFSAANAITWSTYYGGDSWDFGQAITADAFGNAYITGYTFSPFSTSLPVPIELANPGGSTYYQPTNGNGTGNLSVGNTFIAEFGPSTGNLIWGTYFGGNLDINGFALTIDADQDLFLTGNASYDISSGAQGMLFPSSQPSNAYVQTSIIPASSATFITAFNASKVYAWGTYLGYSCTGYGITDYNATDLYVAGVSGEPANWVWENPGGGAWFYNTQLNITGTTNISCISHFNLAGVLGVNSVANSDNKIKVYPNPTFQNVTVQMDLKQEQNVEYSLYNLLGERVYSETIKEHSGTINEQISLSLLPNGNYILQVNAEGNIYHTKIAKLE